MVADVSAENGGGVRPDTADPDLAALARQARWLVIKTVTESKAGHIGGPLSMMDLLVSLYFSG